MRHPVIITSLEEDFRAIGILPKEEKPASTEDEPLEERTRKRRKAGKRGMEKVKVGTTSQRRDWRMAARRRKSKIKAYRKSARGRAARRKAKKFESSETMESTSVRINSLLEDVQDIISTVDDESIENATKSFANVAIISEMLARVFEAVMDEFEEEDAQELGEAAEFFAELAEEAASIATLLHEGVDEDTPEDEIPTYEDIEAKFQEHMDALIDGLELYADITEDEDEDEEIEEDEEDPTEETDED
jgi:hypothetical protein